MDKSALMKRIIAQTKEIVSEDITRKNKRGYDYNIFTLLDLGRQEYDIHEKMIFNILNFPHDKEISVLFIRKFMEVMHMPISYIESEWKVEKEYATINYGRIDLFFLSNTTQKDKRKCIVVELKIDAADQEEQLSRYDEYVNKILGIQDYYILYITLDGHAASKQSIGLANTKRIIDHISYYEQIKKWLDECIKVCSIKEIDDSFIKQYCLLIEKLHGDVAMKKKIENIIANKNELKAAMEISNILPQLKSNVLKTFMKCIKNKFSDLKMEPISKDIDEPANEYYTRSTVPYLTYKVKDFECSTYGRVSVVVEICVEYELEYLIAYYNENNGYINSTEFKKKQKRKSTYVENAITDVFCVEIRENQYDSIIYKAILDKNDHKYDFKHFSQNCCNLIDNDECNGEAERIAREMVSYIKELKKKLYNIE